VGQGRAGMVVSRGAEVVLSVVLYCIVLCVMLCYVHVLWRHSRISPSPNTDIYELFWVCNQWRWPPQDLAYSAYAKYTMQNISGIFESHQVAYIAYYRQIFGYYKNLDISKTPFGISHISQPLSWFSYASLTPAG
jgi:hypothetical protein